MWYWIFKWLTIGPVIRIIGRPKITGRDRLPPTGPAILASNHQAIADSLFLPLMVSRQVLFVTKLDAFASRGVWGAITRWICTMAGQIPIDRTNSRAARAALDTSERLLRAGNVLGIYPEGTRSPDGRIYKGKTGVIRIAAATGAPVIPVGIRGTRDVNPIGSPWWRFGKVRIVLGEPMHFSYLASDLHDVRALRKATDQLMHVIAELAQAEYVDVMTETVKNRDIYGGG
jgi:1-acyl-sn-glycerol-3-phosphate acyltransferase